MGFQQARKTSILASMARFSQPLTKTNVRTRLWMHNLLRILLLCVIAPLNKGGHLLTAGDQLMHATKCVSLLQTIFLKVQQTHVGFASIALQKGWANVSA